MSAGNVSFEIRVARKLAVESDNRDRKQRKRDQQEGGERGDIGKLSEGPDEQQKMRGIGPGERLCDLPELDLQVSQILSRLEQDLLGALERKFRGLPVV